MGQVKRERERERERDAIFLSTLVNDWDLYQKLLDHLFSRHVKTTPDLHPILMSEPPVSHVDLKYCPAKTAPIICPYFSCYISYISGTVNPRERS